MSAAVTTSMASTSMMPATVRWRLPTFACSRFHRRKVRVTLPSRIPSTTRSSNSTSDQRRTPVGLEPVRGEAQPGHSVARLDLLVRALVAGVLDAPLAVDLHVLVRVERRTADRDAAGTALSGQHDDVLQCPDARRGVGAGEIDLGVVALVAGEHL